MKAIIRIARTIMQSYNAKCKPLCQEIGMPQTAFDILMFLANNPEFDTARDIVEWRYIKANLVSINVESLVREGYLTREKKSRRQEKGAACMHGKSRFGRGAGQTASESICRGNVSEC